MVLFESRPESHLPGNFGPSRFLSVLLYLLEALSGLSLTDEIHLIDLPFKFNLLRFRIPLALA